MGTLTTAFRTAFTSANTTFCVQVTGNGSVRLERRATSGDAWANVDTLPPGIARDVKNSVVSQEWRFVEETGTPTVKAYD
jgi:hypothetical protein